MKGPLEAKSFWKPLHWDSMSKDVGTGQVVAGVTTIRGLKRPAATTVVNTLTVILCVHENTRAEPTKIDHWFFTPSQTTTVTSGRHKHYSQNKK